MLSAARWLSESERTCVNVGIEVRAFVVRYKPPVIPNPDCPYTAQTSVFGFPGSMTASIIIEFVPDPRSMEEKRRSEDCALVHRKSPRFGRSGLGENPIPPNPFVVVRKRTLSSVGETRIFEIDRYINALEPVRSRLNGPESTGDVSALFTT